MAEASFRTSPHHRYFTVSGLTVAVDFSACTVRHRPVWRWLAQSRRHRRPIAARVMAAAGPGEILTSQTVRDLVVGANIMVEDRGPHALKGIEGTWQLFAATQA
jgi:hypothetical protein